MYICNCNGIREREVHDAIRCGATRPKDVFNHKGCEAQCAKCVPEMREMIAQARRPMLAAE